MSVLESIESTELAKQIRTLTEHGYFAVCTSLQFNSNGEVADVPYGVMTITDLVAKTVTLGNEMPAGYMDTAWRWNNKLNRLEIVGCHGISDRSIEQVAERVISSHQGPLQKLLRRFA